MGDVKWEEVTAYVTSSHSLVIYLKNGEVTGRKGVSQILSRQTRHCGPTTYKLYTEK